MRFLDEALDVQVQAIGGFSLRWDGLVRGGAGQVEAVRAAVLEHLPVYLDTLGARRDERLREALQRVEDASIRRRQRMEMRDRSLGAQYLSEVESEVAQVASIWSTSLRVMAECRAPSLRHCATR